jgi:hypothetical protein
MSCVLRCVVTYGIDDFPICQLKSLRLSRKQISKPILQQSTTVRAGVNGSFVSNEVAARLEIMTKRRGFISGRKTGGENLAYVDLL